MLLCSQVVTAAGRTKVDLADFHTGCHSQRDLGLFSEMNWEFAY